MTDVILPPIPRSSMFDQYGVMNREWQNFFNALSRVLGGVNVPTLDDIIRGVVSGAYGPHGRNPEDPLAHVVREPSVDSDNFPYLMPVCMPPSDGGYKEWARGRSTLPIPFEVLQRERHYGYRYDYPVVVDVNFDSLSSALGASAPDRVVWDSSNVDISSLDGNATTEELHAWREAPHGMQFGRVVRAHVHIAPTTAGAGDVKINLEYVIISNDGTVNTGTISGIQTMSGTAWDMNFMEIDDINGNYFDLGTQIGVRLYRDPTDVADTYGDDVVISTFGLHVWMHGGGSKDVDVE